MLLSRAASNFIDFFRWTGALQIVLIHAGNIFINNSDIMKAPHGPFEYLWWFFVSYGYGRQGLMMFFVFSGALVGGALIQRMKKGDTFFRKYMIDRIVRVHIVLLPVVLIGFVLDEIGRRMFAGVGIYEIFAAHYDLRLLLPPIAGLQGVFFAPYGTNEALWSLGVEFWYYIVFPLLAFPLAIGYAPARRWLALGVGVALFAVLATSGGYWVWGFIPWVLGALASLATRPLIRSRWISAGLLIVVATVLRLAVPVNYFQTFPSEVVLDAVAGLLTANLLITLRFDESEGFWISRFKFHKFFSDFSYSLYAIQLPVLVMVAGVAGHFYGPQWRTQLATSTHYAVAIGGVALVMLCAWLLSLVTERRTPTVRRFVDRFIPGADPAPKGRPAR